MITVTKAVTKEDLVIIFQIREAVFVVEQKVAPEEEYDEFEEESTHFLATLDNMPAGTARWRRTGKGIKLERFAVLQSARGRGVGQALVRAVLEDISSHADQAGTTLYLHAQLPAVPLYEKFGFKTEGDIFMECDIAHYVMKKKK